MVSPSSWRTISKSIGLVAPRTRMSSYSSTKARSPCGPTVAREIVLDSSESDDLQATSLTAIEQFGDAVKVGGDDELLKRVGRLRTKSSAKVKQTAKRLLTKYGQ